MWNVSNTFKALLTQAYLAKEITLIYATAKTNHFLNMCVYQSWT